MGVSMQSSEKQLQLQAYKLAAGLITELFQSCEFHTSACVMTIGLLKMLRFGVAAEESLMPHWD